MSLLVSLQYLVGAYIAAQPLLVHVQFVAMEFQIVST